MDPQKPQDVGSERQDPCPGVSLRHPPSWSSRLPLLPFYTPIFRFCSPEGHGAKLGCNDPLGTEVSGLLISTLSDPNSLLSALGTGCEHLFS